MHPRSDPSPPCALVLPPREAKPRRCGLTMVLDRGLPRHYFADAVGSAAPLIDGVKFGWGTALATPDFAVKLDVVRSHDVRACLGGTLFEKYVLQDRFDAYLDLCRGLGIGLIEISNGTIPMTNTAKATFIRKCADEFEVYSEVGFKDTGRSEHMAPSEWVDAILEDLDAGASKVITEARESGRSGICRPGGELRWGLVEEILGAGIDPDRLVFEAPTKALQHHFVTRLGPDVNLGNIAPDDVIALETLRLGLRSDTLMDFEDLEARVDA